jgi:hypothetical protein
MIPADSPLTTGWRAELAALISAHGLAAIMDAVSAFAELRSRQPDPYAGLFDGLEVKQAAKPARRRIRRTPQRAL